MCFVYGTVKPSGRFGNRARERTRESGKREAMNCDVCRQYLLMTEDPESPALDVVGHLAECLACRDWQHQLTHIEDNVRRLPVPAFSPYVFETILGAAWPMSPPSGGHTVVAPMPLTRVVPPAVLLPFPAPGASSVPVVGATMPGPANRRWLVIGGSIAAAGVLIVGGILLGNLLSGAMRPPGNFAKNNEPTLADSPQAPETPQP